jgi:hypothetical protein
MMFDIIPYSAAHLPRLREGLTSPHRLEWFNVRMLECLNVRMRV